MHTTLNKYLVYYPLTLLKGEHVGRYLREAQKFQWKSISDIEAYQVTKLRNLVQYAIENVPYYAKSIDPDVSRRINSLSDIERLPFVEKSNLINDFSDLCSRQHFIASAAKTTGGSTGQAVTLRKNSDALARERAVTARSYEWANVKMCDSQARLWGVPLEYEDRLYYKIVDFVANRKRMSAFSLNPESMSRYIQVMKQFRPKYLYGYASAIAELARFAYESGNPLPPTIKSVICTSEVLTTKIRESIRGSIGIDPFNEYGCGEVGSVAHECEHRSLHVMSDNLIVELLDEYDRPSLSGEIVVTDLFNFATPLIRYRLRDFGQWAESGCECGRKFPVLEKIFGRAYDFIIGRDGTKIHPEMVMYAFEAIKREGITIDQFQVVQKQLKEFEIRLVIAEDLHGFVEPVIEKKLVALLGQFVEISFLYVKNISREQSGKLRLVKSEVERT